MLPRIAVAAAATIVFAAPGLRSQSAALTDSAMVATIETSLQKLTQMHQEVRDIHPLLNVDAERLFKRMFELAGAD